ncbi:MAG: hypothetical protein KGJ41_17430 [Rhodospirillales bacterium]|nr:hypothetical protein [Rhodospirillales bacterium]
MTPSPEPWRTAQDYLDTYGDRAEEEIRRLARELTAEGNAEDAAKLFDVFQAVRMLRDTRRRDDGLVH